MICMEKLKALKQKEEELTQKWFTTYLIRIKVSLFENLDSSVKYPKYSYIIPDMRYGLKMFTDAQNLCSTDISMSLDDALKFYDDIAMRIIDLCRSYQDVIDYCKSHYIRIPTNKEVIQGGRTDYIHKLAISVIGAAIVECSKSGIIFDQMSEDDVEEILLSNSFMIFDLYAITIDESDLFDIKFKERVVSDLDNFIIAPKHIDKDCARYAS